VLSEEGASSTASFPRSTINRTLEDFRLLLLAPVLTKSKKISPEVYRALSLNSPSGADSASDQATAPKRIATFLQLCAAFVPCDHSAYDQVVFPLDAEVDTNADKAKADLALVQDQQLLPIISKLQDEAVSVLLQVLYALHQGHVQFLLGDYRGRLIDAHGSDAFPKAPRLGKDGIPRNFQDGRPPTPNLEQVVVDMSKHNDAESTDSKDSGSSILYTSGGEEDKANTPVPSAPQMEATHSQVGMSMPPRTTEAADFGSDTSPRTESGDNDELSQAGPN
jgi:hypothetical protein